MLSVLMIGTSLLKLFLEVISICCENKKLCVAKYVVS